jgi:hypothetical protein
MWGVPKAACMRLDELWPSGPNCSGAVWLMFTVSQLAMSSFFVSLHWLNSWRSILGCFLGLFTTKFQKCTHCLCHAFCPSVACNDTRTGTQILMEFDVCGFTAICRNNLILVKITQQQRTLFMKTHAFFGNVFRKLPGESPATYHAHKHVGNPSDDGITQPGRSQKPNPRSHWPQTTGTKCNNRANNLPRLLSNL